MWCSSVSCGPRRRRRLPSKPDASRSRVSPVVPTVVRSVSVTVTQPSDHVNSASVLAANSSRCLSGSTFPDSDTGYFGSTGLYEGSCDHLETDYDRRYSVEMVGDTEVFSEHVEIAYSQIPVESFVTASCSESQSAVPCRSVQLFATETEQFGIANFGGVDASSESNSVPLNEEHDDVATTSLSDEICQIVYAPTDKAVPDKPATYDAVGLDEVAGKYTTVQLLLEMNMQRAGIGNAEGLSFDRSSPEYQSSTCLDREALASLATRYSVINECLQLGRVVSKTDDSGEPEHIVTSECVDVISEQPQTIKVSAVTSAHVTENVTPVKDFNANLSYDGQVIKEDPSLHTNEAEQLVENFSVISRETDRCKFDGDKPATLVPSSDLSLMYMAMEDPHYYPIYGRLRDVETGVLNIYPHLTDNNAVMGESKTEMVALSEQEQIWRNARDTEDKASPVNVRYATDFVQHVVPITAQSELSVVNYSSLALLNDVENGNVLTSCMSLVDKTRSKQISGKHVNISEGETETTENRDLSDGDRGTLDDDSRGDGFIVVETKKHRKQRKKREFEEPATQSSSLSKSHPSVDESHSAIGHDANVEELRIAEHSVLSEAEESTFARSLTEAGAEECPIQNSAGEVIPCVHEMAGTRAIDLGVQTVPRIHALAREEAITGMVPGYVEPQKSETTEAQLDPRVPVSTVTTEEPPSAVKHRTIAEVGRQLGDQNFSGDAVLADKETLPVNITDDADKNQEALSRETSVCVGMELEMREQVENDVKATEFSEAGITEKNVTNVQPEPLAFIKQRAAASEPFASASHETVRVERLITVTPTAVVKVVDEPCAEILSKDTADVAHSPESAVMSESIEQAEHEASNLQIIDKPSQVAVECDQAHAEEIIEATSSASISTNSGKPTQKTDTELQNTVSEYSVDKSVIECGGYYDTIVSETGVSAELIAAPSETNAAKSEADLFSVPMIDTEEQKEKTADSSTSNTGDSVVEAADTAECTMTTKALTVMESEPGVSVAAYVAQVEPDNIETDAVAVNKINEKNIHETTDSFSEISESADTKTKTTKVTFVPLDDAKVDKYVAHYASLGVLGDVESGRIYNRLKARRFLQEWDAKNVDDVVAYIVGSEAKKHRKKHKRVKRASESEVGEVKAAETGSEMMTVSRFRAKSEERVLWVDEQTEKLDTVASDVEEETIEEPEDDSESESFTVVETRKHRRQRHKHDAEEMWAQYLDDMDTAGAVTEQSEIESTAESLQETVCDDAETVLESVAGLRDAKGVTDVASDTVKVSDESAIEFTQMALKDDLELETVHDILNSDVSAECTTEVQPTAALEFGHKQSAKLDSLVHDADVHISDEICEPVDEPMVKVMPPTQFEVHKNVKAEVAHPVASSQLLQDESVPTKPYDVNLETTIPMSDSYAAKDNRLYSDVARGKHGVDVLDKTGTETTTDGEISVAVHVIAMNVEAVKESSAEVPAESAEDLCSNFTPETEHHLIFKDSSRFLVTSSPETSAELMDANADQECTEDIQTRFVSDITAISSASDVIWPVAEATEKIADPTEHSLELYFTEQAAQLRSTENFVEHRRPESLADVAVVDIKFAVDLSTVECDDTAPSVEIPAAEVSAELPPPPSDVQILTSSCYLPAAEGLIEPPAAEAGVESCVSTNRTEVSDIGIVSETSVEFSDGLSVEDNLESSNSQFSDAAVAFPRAEFRSTEFGSLESGVPILVREVASGAESTKDANVELHSAENIQDLGCQTVAEDEQRVADLFSESTRAVQMRSGSSPATRAVTENEVNELNSEVEGTVSCNEDASRKSAVSSAESFIAEILPYYYAALAVLREVERDTIQMPRDTTLPVVSKMSQGVTERNYAGDFIVSADDHQGSDAVSTNTSEKMSESNAGKEDTTEIVSISTSDPHEAAVPLSDSEQSGEMLRETARPTAGKDQESVFETRSTVDTRNKHLLDRNHADVVALQYHYQSLKLLNSVETGNLPILPVFSSQLTTSNDRTSLLITTAPTFLSAKHSAEDSTDTFTSVVHEASRPSRDSLKDVSSEDDDVSVCVHDEPQETQTASSRLESSNLPAAEEMTPVVLLAEHRDVGFSSEGDNVKAAQSMHEDHAEHEHDVTVSMDDVGVHSKCDHATSSSDLLVIQHTSELPMDDVIEVQSKESRLNVSDLQDGGSYVDSSTAGTAADGDTNDSMRSPVSIEKYSLSEGTVSITGLTEELVPNVCVPGLSQLQQQDTDERETVTEQHANQGASCFSELQPPSDENINVPTMSNGDKSLTPPQLTEEKAKKKRRNRKKKTKSPKDDLTPLEASLDCTDLVSVNESNNVSTVTRETCSTAAAEARNFDDDDLHTITLASCEASAGVASSGPKRNKKRKRTKKAGQVASDIAVSNSIIVDTTALPATVTAAEQSILSGVEVSDRVSNEPSKDTPSLVAEAVARKDVVETLQEVVTTQSRPGNWNSQPVLSPLGVACSETVGLPTATSDGTALGLQLSDRTVTAEASVRNISPTDVTVMPREDNDDFQKPLELSTQTVGLEISNSAVGDDSALSTKPGKRKNRKRRKRKTTDEPLPVEDGKESKSRDNSISLDSVVQNHEKLDISVVAEANELMTESLEEDTKITEQPLDILSVKDNKEMSDPSSLHIVSPVSKTVANKKKKRKSKASKVAQPGATDGSHDSDFVTESLPGTKDDLSEKDEIIDEASALNLTSEISNTGLPVATLTVTTEELDNTNVILPVSKDEECKVSEEEAQFEVGSSGGSSLDEYQLNVPYATEQASDSTTVLESSKKRRKKRRRNRHRKISHKTTCSEADRPTDLYSLLMRIIEICSETKDSQAADSGNQLQTDKHDTSTSQSVQAPKAARKPRKYKRSKPIRLPPDVTEQPAELISAGAEKSGVAATSPTHAMQSADIDTSRISPTNQLSGETKSDYPDSLNFHESPSQLVPTEGVNIRLTDSTVVDNSTVSQNVEETDTIIAWSASSSKMSDQSSEHPYPKSPPDPVLADPCEGQLTDVSEFAVPATDNVEDTVAETICPLDMAQTELQESCLKDEPKPTVDELHYSTINQTNQWNIAGCMAADVYTVISEHANVNETSDTVNFRSEPNDDTDLIKPLTVVADNHQVPDADDGVEILDRNSNPCWFDGAAGQQAPTSCCETSSVDSEVERIFSNRVADDDDRDDESSLVGDGDSLKDAADDDDDDELGLEDNDVVITEYVDVEIIEETETITVIDNDDDLSPSISDRRSPDIDGAPSESKSITSGVSPLLAAVPVKGTAEDVVLFQPYSFRLHENEDEHQLPGMTPDASTGNTKAPAGHDTQGQCPQWFSNYSATGDMPSFHWPPTPEDRAVHSDVAEVLGLRRFSRKRQHPTDDTSSSDSGDNKQGSDNSQFFLSHHQAAGNFAADPVPAWPFLASHSQWSSPDAVIDASFGEAFVVGKQNLAREPQDAAKPPARPWQNVTATVPVDVDLADRSYLVHPDRDFSREEEELSGDSLNESSSVAAGSFFEEPKTFARATVSSDQAQASCGDIYESCSTDSLDFQTKAGPASEHPELRRSSTDCISEDSLAETSFVAGKDDADSTMNKDIAETQSAKNATTASPHAVVEQRQDADLTRVNVRRKKFRGVSAKVKCPKPGVAVKTNRKRKLGNAGKDGSDRGETDSDSAELE